MEDFCCYVWKDRSCVSSTCSCLQHGHSELSSAVQLLNHRQCHLLCVCVDAIGLQEAARNAPQLTREQIRLMRRAHDPNFKERESYGI